MFPPTSKFQSPTIFFKSTGEMRGGLLHCPKHDTQQSTRANASASRRTPPSGIYILSLEEEDDQIQVDVYFAVTSPLSLTSLRNLYTSVRRVRDQPQTQCRVEHSTTSQHNTQCLFTPRHCYCCSKLPDTSSSELCWSSLVLPSKHSHHWMKFHHEDKR